MKDLLCLVDGLARGGGRVSGWSVGGEKDGRTSRGQHCQVDKVRICKGMHLIEVQS